MQKEFVPYELALELKQLRFDEECLAWYVPSGPTDYKFSTNKNQINSYPKHEVTPIPLWQQAFKFILTKLDLEIDYNSKYELNFDGEFNLYKLTWIDYEGYSSEFDTGGNENCLKELIKIVKKKS